MKIGRNRKNEIYVDFDVSGSIRYESDKNKYIFNCTVDGDSQKEIKKWSGDYEDVIRSNTDVEVGHGDIIVICDVLFLICLTESKIPDSLLEGKEVEVRAIYSLLYSVTYSKKKNELIKVEEIVKEFAVHLAEVIGAKYFYVSYGDQPYIFPNLDKGIDDERFVYVNDENNASNLMRNLRDTLRHLGRIKRPYLCNTKDILTRKTYTEYCSQLAAVPIYQDEVVKGVMVFTATETGTEGGASGPKSLMFLTIATSVLETVLSYYSIINSIIIAESRIAGEKEARRQKLSKHQQTDLDSFFEKWIEPLKNEKNINLLLLGSSGSGKGYVAEKYREMLRKMPKNSNNKKNIPYVVANFATIPRGLRLSELTGWKKGAFNDAKTDTDGYLKCAEGGVLFIDEFADIDEEMQIALLTILGNRRYRILGDNSREEHEINCTILLATSRNLPSLIKEGRFRADLLNRFAAVRVPSLSERKEDIYAQIDEFLKQNNMKMLPEAKSSLAAMDYSKGNMWLLYKVLFHLRVYAARYEEERTVKDVIAAWNDVIFLYRDNEYDEEDEVYFGDDIISLEEMKAKYIKYVCEHGKNTGLTASEIRSMLDISQQTIDKYKNMHE